MLNKDFYPTPAHLIMKMLAGVNLDDIETVLEPSAGKGDICDLIRKRDYRNRLNIDVIEIDEDLRSTLIGKEYNVIWDDFLSFKSRKSYGLIIANFPFSEGDKHLAHAISLLESNGGRLICLVNAETIQNQYTNLRKSIKEKLDACNASIEFIDNAFVDAERKTGVTVALIDVTIEPTRPVSLILESLKDAKSTEDIAESPDKELIEADFISALVSRFNIECRLGEKLIREYFALKPYIVERFSRDENDRKWVNGIIKLEIEGAYQTLPSHINAYLSGVRHKYWELLLNDPRFTASYTSNILNELSRKLEALRNKDFNKFNIEALQIELRSKVSEGIEASILKLFDEFSYKFAFGGKEFNEGNIHYFNGWKTNKAHKINNKVIIPMNGFSAWSSTKDRLEYAIHDKMRDMVKVFNYLARDVADVPKLVGQTIEHANATQDFSNVDMRYFDITFYKKGTAHIKFKDQKLLNKFNIYGSQKRGWLPPAYGKRKYDDMSKDEKEVIDSFQGKEEYEKVLMEPEYYLANETQFLLEAPNPTHP